MVEGFCWVCLYGDCFIFVVDLFVVFVVGYCLVDVGEVVDVLLIVFVDLIVFVGIV